MSISQLLQQRRELNFNEVQRILSQLGFRQVSLSRLHGIYAHDQVPELLSIQNSGGQVKPWQLRQLLYLIQKYKLENPTP